jgi:hypothetical protein
LIMIKRVLLSLINKISKMLSLCRDFELIHITTNCKGKQSLEVSAVIPRISGLVVSFILIVIIAGCGSYQTRTRQYDFSSPQPSHQSQADSSQVMESEDLRQVEAYYGAGVGANQDGRWLDAQDNFEKALKILSGLDIDEKQESEYTRNVNMLLKKIVQDYKTTLVSLGGLDSESSISAFLERYANIQNLKLLSKDTTSFVSIKTDTSARQKTEEQKTQKEIEKKEKRLKKKRIDSFFGKRIPTFYGFVTVNYIEYREATKKYMIVDITVENTTNKKVEMNSAWADLEVIDGDGYTYKEANIDAAFDGIDKKEAIEEIPPGEKRRGQFVFRKPENTKNMILKFRVMKGIFSQDEGVLIRLK